MKNPFAALNQFERILWLSSVGLTVVSFLLFPLDWVTLVASLIGVTALIFVAKGRVLGQILSVVFAVFYGIVSYACRYYGEMITYLGMTAPMAVFSIVTWLRNPYRDTAEVKVHRLKKGEWALMWGLTAAVTVGFYFILGELGNAQLLISTFSVMTSFIASYLTMLRSPYYALAYAANDVVLMILWILAAAADPGNLPMVMCFLLFLVNDIYGFIQWRRMQRRQEE